MQTDTDQTILKAVNLLSGVGPKDKVICGNDLPKIAAAILQAGL